VLVPSLLLGGAFLAAAAWLDGPAAANRPLAIGLGGLLMGAGLLAQLLPEAQPERTAPTSAQTGADVEGSESSRKD
jgi:hypothetical protein